jgi:hypothetical protein
MSKNLREVERMYVICPLHALYFLAGYGLLEVYDEWKDFLLFIPYMTSHLFFRLCFAFEGCKPHFWYLLNIRVLD